jgi:hypothetical protein
MKRLKVRGYVIKDLGGDNPSERKLSVATAVADAAQHT